MSFIFLSNLRENFHRPTLCVAVLVALSSIACPVSSAQVPSAVAPQLTSASNVKAPAGSYQLSCLILDVRADKLRAICQAISGDWQTTELHNPDLCPGDIANEN